MSADDNRPVTPESVKAMRADLQRQIDIDCGKGDERGAVTPERLAEIDYKANKTLRPFFSATALPYVQDLLRHIASQSREIERHKTYSEAYIRGINDLWKLLEDHGFVPCNNGWLDETRRALSDLAAARAEIVALRALGIGGRG